MRIKMSNMGRRGNSRWSTKNPGVVIEGIFRGFFETQFGTAASVEVTEPTEVAGETLESPPVMCAVGDTVAFVVPTAAAESVKEASLLQDSGHYAFVRIAFGEPRPSKKRRGTTFIPVKVEAGQLPRGEYQAPPRDNADADDDVPF